jgi:hypothetical protein
MAIEVRDTAMLALLFLHKSLLIQRECSLAVNIGST